MTDLESQLRARLLQTFLLEASEQLSLMTRTLDELELGGDPVQPLEVFYRAAHSLKRVARRSAYAFEAACAHCGLQCRRIHQPQPLLIQLGHAGDIGPTGLLLGQLSYLYQRL